ncbi:MAG: outer membrane protein assembly factor BamB family protein [Pirellulales bacterium]
MSFCSRPTTLLVLLTTVLVLSGNGPTKAGNWPQWRGPQGTSVSDETGLPLAWSETEGVVWKCKLPEWGTSTPALWQDAIFVTAQEGETLLLVKIGKKSGRVEWTRTVGTGSLQKAEHLSKQPGERGRQVFHPLQNLASPSPVTDGETVVVHFGNGELAAYDFQGNRRWRRNLQDDYGPYTIWWGHANSPVLYENLVISACMQDSLVDLEGDRRSASYVVAHDKLTGEVKWKTPRATKAVSEPCDAYTTPLLRQTDRGAELLVMGGNQIDGYDPATGKQLWFLPGVNGNRTITGPTLGHGMIYTTTGMRGPLLAIKLGGQGQRTRQDVVWEYSQGTPDSPCPVVSGDLLFLVTDNGIAKCLDAANGKLQWQQRLKGEFKSSPLAADGRVYFLNQNGMATVVAASNRFEKLAENQIDDETIASLAPSDGRIYLRGRKALYCLGKE